MKHYFPFSLTAVLAILLSVTSCTKSSGLLDTVPANSTAILSLDGDQLLDKAGFKKTGDTYTAPEWFDKLDAPDDAMARFEQFASAIDMGQIIVYMPEGAKGNNSLFTAEVSDAAKLAELLAQPGAKTEALGSYTTVKMGHIGIAYTDRQVWMKSPVYDMAKFVLEIDGQLSAARQKSAAQLQGVKSALTSDALLGCAVNNKFIAQANDVEVETSEWATAQVRLDGNRLNFASQHIEADGTPFDNPGVEAINTAVLGYVPSVCNMFLAAGLNDQMAWDNLSDIIASTGGYQAQGVWSIILPYLKAIDGTVMIAAGPTSPSAYIDATPSNWQAIAMVHMAQDKVNQAVATISGLLSSQGVEIEPQQQGVSKVTLPGDMTVYFGSVDGYLAVANFPFSPNNQNPYAPLVNGKDAAISVTLPVLNTIHPTLPAFGLTFESTSADGKSNGFIQLTGTEQDFIPAIVEALK